MYRERLHHQYQRYHNLPRSLVLREYEGLSYEDIAKITNTFVPSILYDIYNSSYENVVWKKEEMEEKLRKLIGEIDESC